MARISIRELAEWFRKRISHLQSCMEAGTIQEDLYSSFVQIDFKLFKVILNQYNCLKALIPLRPA